MSLGLVKSAQGERADVFVLIPDFPEALFRGAVVRDGVPVSDILQVWLDVSHHPARGAEQAQHIWKRVLEPDLLRTAE